MSNETLNDVDSNSLLIALSKKIEFTTSTTANGVKKLTLNNNFGQGYIEQIRFRNGLSVFNFDLKLKNDLNIEISNCSSNSLFFLYSLSGNAYHSFGNSGKFSKINEFKSVAFSANKTNSSLLVIEKDHHFKCQMLSISSTHFLQNFEHKLNNDSNLNEIFEHLENNFFECTYDLTIEHEIQHIEDIINDNPITFNLQLHSKYELILAIHIEQIYNSYYNKGKQLNISKSEIKKIREISNYIIENPGLNHSQDNLCSQFFISQSKLQHGFKEVHKTTVSNFTRNVRLEKAEELLSNTDLNISEVVYTVGFTSRSYFSKIFKQKFGCNPTAFKNQFKNRNHLVAIN